MQALMTILLVSLLLTPTTLTIVNQLVIYIEDDLQEAYPVQVDKVLSDINKTVMSLERGANQNIELTVHPLKLSQNLFRTWSHYRRLHDAVTAEMSLLLATCQFCTDSLSVSSYCANLCYDIIMTEWTTCEEHRVRMNTYNSLLTKLVNTNKQVVVFYDKERELMLHPAVDTLLRQLKVVYWDTSHLNCSRTQCELPLEQHNLNTISNFILSTNHSWKAIIHQKQNMIQILGPDNNWLIDNRFQEDVTQDTTDILIPYTQGGNYVSVITSNPRLPGVMEMVSLVVRGYCVNSLYNNTYQGFLQSQQLKLLSSNRKVRECELMSVQSETCYEPSTGNQWNLQSLFPVQFQGFYGRTLIVVTKTYAPFVTWTMLPNGTHVYSGLVIELLDALAESLNFKYTISEVPDGKFGICTNWTNRCEADSWNGMIGMLHRKEANIAASGLTIDARRETVVDFTFPFWEEPSSVLIRRQTHGVELMWVYKPLTLQVWVCIVVTTVTVAVLLWMFARKERDVKQCVEPMTKFTNALWYIIGAFLQQGGFHQPQTSSSQILASAWWAVIVIVYGIYTGNLIAFLSVTKVTLPFNSLQGMVAQNQYTYGTEDGFIQLMLFKSATSGLYHDIWTGIESQPGAIVPDTPTGLDKVNNENYAFISDKTYLQTISRNNCELSIIQEEFFKVGFGLAVQEGWPYKKYFDDMVLKLVEGGFVERWRQKHFPQNQCDFKLKFVKSKTISVIDMIGNFCTLLLGLAVSALILLLEILFFKYRKKTRYPCKEFTESYSSSDFIRSPSCENVLFKVNESQSPDCLNTVCHLDKAPIKSEYFGSNGCGITSSNTRDKQFNLSSFLFKPKGHLVHRHSRRGKKKSKKSTGSEVCSMDGFSTELKDITPDSMRGSRSHNNGISHISNGDVKSTLNTLSLSPKIVCRKSSLRGGTKTDLNVLSRKTSTIYKTYLPDNPLSLL